MLNILAEYTGHTREELHDALKHKFLSYTDGNNIVLTRSTEELSTVECEEYYEDIKRWAAGELNLFIPDPGDAYGVL